jgi:ATP-binding cassette subfamily C (CFTR/MRP) protein 4
MVLGASRALQQQDVPSCPDEDLPARTTDELQTTWDAELAALSGEGAAGGKKPPSLWRALYRANRVHFWVAGWYAFLESVCCIAQPVLLRFLITWLLDPMSGGLALGLLLALGLSFAGCMQAVVHHQLYLYTMRAGWRLRLACCGLVHRKLLRISSATLLETGKGLAINLISNDVQRFDAFIPALHFYWAGPMDLVVVYCLLGAEVGFLAATAGVAVVLVTIWVQVHWGFMIGARRRVTAVRSDERIKLATEVVSTIMSVKAYGWEPSFMAKVARARAAESASILRAQILKGSSLALYVATPALASLALFSVYHAQGNVLRVDTIFSSLSLIHVVRLSIGKNFARYVLSIYRYSI